MSDRIPEYQDETADAIAAAREVLAFFGGTMGSSPDPAKSGWRFDGKEISVAASEALLSLTDYLNHTPPEPCQALIARLRHERDEHKRAWATKCVLCHRRYGEDEDRSTLYQLPDGCTAHEQCYMDDPSGIEGYARYHDESVRAEDHERELERAHV